jgi:hypothetical protein
MLNVIFGEIHGDFESQFLATGYMRPFVTGSRAGKGDGNWTVASREPLQHAAAGRPDWIQVGGAPVAPAPGASPVTPAAAAGAASPPSASTRSGAGAAPTPSAGTTSTAGAASTTGSASPASPAPAVVPNRDAFYQDIEKRLTVLKGLRDKGLITEDEYNEKRKAILKDL